MAQNQSGRYVVKLPVKPQMMAKLGDSEDIALKRLRALERRFKREATIKAHYQQFMEEYVKLGHIKLVNKQSNEETISCYLSHYCVVKSAEGSYKLRVIRRILQNQRTGVLFLNDVLMVRWTRSSSRI